MILLTDGETMCELTVTHTAGANAAVAAVLVTGDDQAAVFLKPEVLGEQKDDRPDQIIIKTSKIAELDDHFTIERDDLLIPIAPPMRASDVQEAMLAIQPAASKSHQKYVPDQKKLTIDFTNLTPGVFKFEAGKFMTAAVNRSKIGVPPFAIDLAAEIDLDPDTWGLIND